MVPCWNLSKKSAKKFQNYWLLSFLIFLICRRSRLVNCFFFPKIRYSFLSQIKLGVQKGLEWSTILVNPQQPLSMHWFLWLLKSKDSDCLVSIIGFKGFSKLFWYLFRVFFIYLNCFLILDSLLDVSSLCLPVSPTKWPEASFPFTIEIEIVLVLIFYWDCLSLFVGICLVDYKDSFMDYMIWSLISLVLALSFILSAFASPGPSS